MFFTCTINSGRGRGAVMNPSRRRSLMRILDAEGVGAVQETIAGYLWPRITEPLETPLAAVGYFQAVIGSSPREVFGMLTIDNRHRGIAWHELALGTIDSATVHPRELVRVCLADNAAAVILAHNHPSGTAEPSAADQAITRRITEALTLIDVRVLDHIVVGSSPVSMAERGLI